MEISHDSSDSEEEILVYANFKDLLDHDVIKPGNLHVVKAIGVDSEKPVIQLNNYFFQGEYDTCMGTNLFFEEDPDPPKYDPIFEDVPEKPLKYLCKTRKVLNMNRIFLTPKGGTAASETKNYYPEFEEHAGTVEDALLKFQTYMDKNDTEPPTKVNLSQDSLQIPIKPKIQKMLSKKPTFRDSSDEDDPTPQYSG